MRPTLTKVALQMFADFDPKLASEPYFERRRGVALAVALFAHFLVAGVVIWLEMTKTHEEIVEVGLDEPTIENLDIEEEIEVEEEPEPEPEPEKPKPKPKRQEIQNVDKQTKQITESDVAPEREPEPEQAEPEPEPPKKEEPAPVAEKPKKKKKADIGDRTKPRSFPADATKPKPEKGNKTPEYPSELRKQNITGLIKIKLNIHMDGSVRGMKVLKKKVSGVEDPSKEDRAKKLFLKAVIAAVKTWKFKPAKLKGKTIAVWWPVTIPFNLN